MAADFGVEASPDCPLRRGLGGRPVQLVVDTADRPHDPIDGLGEAVAAVPGVVDDAGAVGDRAMLANGLAEAGELRRLSVHRVSGTPI